MRRTRSLVAVAVSLGLLSGLGEIAEAAGHLLETGHVAHVSGDHADAPAPLGAEHGCTTTRHVCGCCASASVVASAQETLPARAVTRAQALDPTATRPSDGHGRGPFHPPKT